MHLSGPAFDLDQHGETVAAEIAGRLADIVIALPGGTRVRIETYMDTTDTTTLEASPVTPDDSYRPASVPPEDWDRYAEALGHADRGTAGPKHFRTTEALRAAHPELGEDDR